VFFRGYGFKGWNHELTRDHAKKASEKERADALFSFGILGSEMIALKIKSNAREEMIDITDRVVDTLPQDGEGVCVVFVQHTTCGVTVNENADPDVQADMLGFLRRLIPQHEPHFKHGEHNSDAHIKSSLVGSSVTVPFADGKLMLGRWQGIYLCEFDGPRERKVLIVTR
jgi:secondary thiamine-phosphate synthase enzyme